MTEKRTEPLSPDEQAPGNDAPQADEGGARPDGPEEQVAALREELEETKQQFLRARADYQNLQRRSQEERQEFGRYQLTSIVLNFLPVLDDLERAIDAASGEGAEEAWLEGVRLVQQKFKGVLEAAGVQEIHALNQPFDPEKHEAVGPAPGPEGQVVHLVQRGYMLGDRVIRPAMVMVGSGQAQASDSESESAGT